MKTALILHGMPSKEEYFDPNSSSPSNSHWLPWVQHQLLLNNILAQTPELPHPYQPVYEKWCEVFERFQIDEQDQVIGQMKRSEVYVQHLSNFRVINAFIVNAKGELWIPRRTANKKIFPLCLDMSVGGHVESGDTYEETLKRETQEELNIDTDKKHIRFLGHASPEKDGVSAHMHVYELFSEETPDYNRNDFVESFWLTPEAFFERIKNGDKTKEDLPKLIQLFYGKDL